MLKEFPAYGLSAAGISHVITAKSFFRRMIWIVSLIMISATMMYMTYNVLQEYLKYPVVMQMRKTFRKEMAFPAVTVCSYTLIPLHNVKEANLEHMEDLRNILQSLPRYGISVEEKVRCLKDPLCRWSRFLDKCFCDKNACSTTACYPYKNETICACSKALCLPSYSDFTYNCSIVKEKKDEACVCKGDFKYPKYKPKTDSLTQDFLEAVEALNVSKRTRKLLMHLKNSTHNNLRDIDKFLKPNITIRDNYGISFDNMVLSCTFGSLPCNLSRDVSTLYSPNYGKCYTFNYAGEQDAQAKMKIVKHSGKSQGLELYLKNPKYNTLPLLTSNYGARVAIHEPRSLPFASQNGFDIRSGDITSVMVRYAEVNRLGPPWGACAWDGDNKTSSYLDVPYDKLGCERKCINSLIFKNCKCWHTVFLSGTLLPFRSHICRLKDEGCIMKALMGARNNIKCQCPPPCREKTYKKFISTGRINREFFRVLKMVRSLKMINGSPAVVEPEFKLGMMGLQVYFGSFVITNTSEASIYSWEFLVANVGGNLGLFLGLSLITFIEIFELIVDIIARVFCRKRRNYR